MGGYFVAEAVYFGDGVGGEVVIVVVSGCIQSV